MSKLELLLETRRNNLRALARQRNNMLVAGDLGWSESRLSQIIGPNPIRNVTEKTAHHIESRLGLAEGWLNEERVDLWRQLGIDCAQFEATV